jgi:1-phosphofructokinase family hexose kinase
VIRVVGANPAMDRVNTWPNLRLGEVNRASEVAVVPGGKGFNVARAIVRLGSEATAYGFLGGHIGDALREMITADGVHDRHTLIAAETRVCFVAVEPSGRSTVLNEPGPAVEAVEIERFLQALRADVAADDLLALSGSLPDSVESAVAAAVVTIANEAGARALVDIHGSALQAAVGARPWMVKCNRRELLDLLGGGEEDDVDGSRLPALMRQVQALGVQVVVVTMGAQGALIADGEGVAHVRVPRIVEVNPTGSGDLLLAGLAVGLERGRSPREALVLGAACGTAGASHLRPELPPGFDAETWTAGIAVEALGSPG